MIWDHFWSILSNFTKLRFCWDLKFFGRIMLSWNIYHVGYVGALIGPIFASFIVAMLWSSDKNVNKTKNCLFFVKVLASAYTTITILIISGRKMLGHLKWVFLLSNPYSVIYYLNYDINWYGTCQSQIMIGNQAKISIG